MEKYYHRKKIDVPIYGGELFIIFTNDMVRIKKEFPEDYEDDDFVFFSYNNNYEYILMFNFHADRKITHGFIAHECLHATNFILDSRGVIADFKNDEPSTYLLTWIVDEVYKFMKNKSIRIND